MAEAKGFGLLGEYFNNRWIFGEPVVTRIDAKIDFTWSEADTLTPTGQDYISVRYVGSRRINRVISLPLLSDFLLEQAKRCFRRSLCLFSRRSDQRSACFSYARHDVPQRETLHS